MDNISIIVLIGLAITFLLIIFHILGNHYILSHSIGSNYTLHNFSNKVNYALNNISKNNDIIDKLYKSINEMWKSYNVEKTISTVLHSDNTGTSLQHVKQSYQIRDYVFEVWNISSTERTSTSPLYIKPLDRDKIESIVNNSEPRELLNLDDLPQSNVYVIMKIENIYNILNTPVPSHPISSTQPLSIPNTLLPAQDDNSDYDEYLIELTVDYNISIGKEWTMFIVSAQSSSRDATINSMQFTLSDKRIYLKGKGQNAFVVYVRQNKKATKTLEGDWKLNIRFEEMKIQPI